MRQSILALAVSAAVGIAGAALAAPTPSAVNINPDAGGGDPTITVGALDWAVGNSIATPTVANGNVTDPKQGDVFQIFAHAALGSFLNPGGTSIGGLQLNGPTAATNYEWTFVTGFREQVTGVVQPGGVNGPGASINTVTTAGGSNFFEIWFDDTPDSSNLAGTGFNDGIRILSGTIDAGGPSAFTRNLASSSPGPGGVGNNLDQFITDNYPNIDTANGGGNLTVTITVTSFDPNFFLGNIQTLLLNVTTEQKLAYNQTDPSALFVTGPNGIAPTQPGATVASVSTCNGCSLGFDGIQGGPNQVFQQDASTSFLVQQGVPEPATLGLLGLGLVGLGFAGHRRRAG